MIAIGGGERAGLSESMAHRAGNTSPGQGEARRGGKKTKVKRDARKVMLSGCQSVRLAAATWWGGMLSTKRKLILEREKKSWIAGRTDASRKSCFRTVRGTGGGEREKKKTPTRERGAGTSRHSRTDEEKLCLLREGGGQGTSTRTWGLNLRRRSRHRMPGLVCCVCCVLLTACSGLLLRPAATATATAAALATAAATVHTTRYTRCCVSRAG